MQLCEQRKSFQKHAIVWRDASYQRMNRVFWRGLDRIVYYIDMIVQALSCLDLEDRDTVRCSDGALSAQYRTKRGKLVLPVA